MFWILIDLLMIAFNYWLFEKEESKGWSYTWLALIVFWVLSFLFDLIVLFGGVL